MHQDPFNEALSEGVSYYYWEEVDGGILNGGSEIMGMKDNVWYWNKQTNTLWLYKWGKVPSDMIMKEPIHRAGYLISHEQKHSQAEWPFGAQSTFVILGIVVAILLSIYFDDGEQITW